MGVVIPPFHRSIPPNKDSQKSLIFFDISDDLTTLTLTVCHDVYISKFSGTTTTTDVWMDSFTPCACARGNNYNAMNILGCASGAFTPLCQQLTFSI